MTARMSESEREISEGVPIGEDEPTNPGDDDDMIEPDADPIDTEVEDADFFLGEEGGGEDA
jgi:hypothetical protein